MGGRSIMLYQLPGKTLFKMILGAMILLSGIFTAGTLHVPKISTVSEFGTTKIDYKQIACMAKNIVHEAGSESLQGQAAVARVVMNRVAHGFAQNPCGVIYQTITVNDNKVCQFSWVCEGKDQVNVHSEKYKTAEKIAWEVMVYGKYKDVVPRSALFFHSINIDPLWPYKKVATIGGHVFYAKVKKTVQHPRMIQDDRG